VEWAKRKPERKAKVKKKPKAQMTAAELTAARKLEAGAAKVREKQFAKRLYEWRCDWQRWLIAKVVPNENEATLALLLVAAAYDWHPSHRTLARPAWPQLVKETDPWDAVTRAVAALFWDGDAPCHLLPNRDIEAVAKDLRLDLTTEWLNDQAGPLSEAYWNLHTKDQLVAIAAELKVTLKGTTKSAMVAELLALRPTPDQVDVGVPMPKEIAKAKRPKGW